MLRLLPLACLLFFSAFAHAQSYYQVDLILFAHTYTEKDQLEKTLPRLLDDHQAIPLKPRESGASGAYQLLGNSTAAMQSAWSRLNHNSQYQPLFHYSWLQPANSQRPVLLPAHSIHGWTVAGTLRVRQSNYYLLDTDIIFKSGSQTFVLEQKQRLKPGNIYYLDHPQAGMLIQVHKVS